MTGEFAFHLAQNARKRCKFVHGRERHCIASGLCPQTQNGACDDPEGAFRTDEELFQIVASVVLDEAIERSENGAVGENRPRGPAPCSRVMP